MGAPRPGPGAVSFVRSCRIGRHRAAPRDRKRRQRVRDLELSHYRRSNALHAGAPGASRDAARRRSTTDNRRRGACRIRPARGKEATGARQGATSPRHASRRWSARLANQTNSPQIGAGCATQKEIALPYLRFSRDKRGYENTFVVHSERRRGKSHSRVLYWFRTPPGVKVGRAALDEDAIRLIEEFNPGVGFDWTRILKGQGTPQEAPPEPQSRRSQQRPRGTEPPPRAVATPAPQEVLPDEAFAVDVEPANEPNEEAPTTLLRDEAPRDERPPDETPPTPAHARLGSEAVSRLRARHAEMLARISETITDPARREELTSQADQLNPDTWVTAEEVSAALEQYESVFASLRAVVGHGRRRRRRGRGARPRPDSRSPQAGPEPPEASDRDVDGEGGSGSEGS